MRHDDPFYSVEKSIEMLYDLNDKLEETSYYLTYEDLIDEDFDQLRKLLLDVQNISHEGPELKKLIDLINTKLNILLYKSFSILHASYLISLNDFFEQYSSDSITTVYPEYYNEFLKQVVRIQANLSVVEQHQETRVFLNESKPSFDDLWDDVLILKRFLSSLPTYKTSLDKIKSEENMKKSSEMEQSRQRKFAYIFGVLFIITIMVLAIFLPDPTPFQYTIFRIIISLAAAGAASMIPGFIEVKISDQVRAGGALGVFVVVYLLNPAQLAINEKSALKPATTHSAQQDTIATDNAK